MNIFPVEGDVTESNNILATLAAATATVPEASVAPAAEAVKVTAVPEVPPQLERDWYVELATPLLGVVTLLGLNVPQLAEKLTTTPDEATPSTMPTTETAEVPNAAILLGDATKLPKVTFAAEVLKLKLAVALVVPTYAAAVKDAAPVVVKDSGLINTLATPLLSVNAVASDALPANVAIVYVVEKVTN
jgi:hypothetical protein